MMRPLRFLTGLGLSFFALQGAAWEWPWEPNRDLAEAARLINQRAPYGVSTAFGPAVVTGAEATGRTLSVSLQVPTDLGGPVSDELFGRLYIALESSASTSWCTEPLFLDMLLKNQRITHVYRDARGRHLASLTLDKRLCGYER